MKPKIRQIVRLPANTDAIAAIKKLKITEGPAVSLATWPAKTYTPTPRVLPTPKAVKSNTLRMRLKRVSSTLTGSITFFLVRIFHILPIADVV